MVAQGIGRAKGGGTRQQGEYYTMPSLSARLVNLALPLLGVKRFFSQPEKLDARIAKLRRKPSLRPGKAILADFDVVEDTSRGFAVVTLTPKEGASAEAPHLLYLHGGGYVMDIAAVHWDSVAWLCRELGTSATVPLYPLAPEHTADEVLDGVYGLYRDLAQDMGANRICVMGDSAGGGMSLAVAQLAKQQGDAMPGQLVLFSPLLDVSMSDPLQREIEPRDRMLGISGVKACSDRYRGELPAEDPRISPLLGDLEALPPTAIFAGTSDILMVDSRKLDERLTALGSTTHLYREYADMFHVWMLLPIPEGRQALGETADFIRQHAGAA